MGLTVHPHRAASIVNFLPITPVNDNRNTKITSIFLKQIFY